MTDDNRRAQPDADHHFAMRPFDPIYGRISGWPNADQSTLLGVVQPPERKPTTLVQGIPPFSALTGPQIELVTAWLLDDDDTRSSAEIVQALAALDSGPRDAVQ